MAFGLEPSLWLTRNNPLEAHRALHRAEVFQQVADEIDRLQGWLIFLHGSSDMSDAQKTRIFMAVAEKAPAARRPVLVPVQDVVEE